MALPKAENWHFKHIECPSIDGVYFPLPQIYKYQKKDITQLKRALTLLKMCVHHFIKRITQVNIKSVEKFTK